MMKKFILHDFALYEYEPPSLQGKSLPWLFFAHANGIPALTYEVFLMSVANALGVGVIAYDARGFGHSMPWDHPTRGEVWSTLQRDFDFLFQEAQKLKPSATHWIVCGHSMGALTALYGTVSMTHKHSLWLLDPPLLPTSLLCKWFLCCLFGLRRLNFNSVKTRRRKKNYESLDVLLAKYQKNPFFKRWNPLALENYISLSFAQGQGSNMVHLKHSIELESLIFEEYPACIFERLFRIPRKVRHGIKPVFFVGECSDTCEPRLRRVLLFLFPQLYWRIVPKGHHMFPLEQKNHCLDVIEKFVQSQKQELL